tara:strand:- start:2492 stop:3865 length:1374 start_codon:yes stop_codon:yes gene_type:complete
MKSIFIFRRDYRIFDNSGLIKCCEDSDEVLLLFIFTPEQIKNNEYFSSNSFQFLIESLEDLENDLFNKNIKLHYFFDDNVKVLKKIKNLYNYDKVYINQDYTPYAIQREKEIENYLLKENKELILTQDYLLSYIGEFCKKDGGAYEVYGAFRKYTKQFKIRKENTKFEISKYKFISIKDGIKLKDLDKYYKKNPKKMIKGGRNFALKILKKASEFSGYEEYRDQLDYETTHLSAYIKYGNLSIREVYHKFVVKFGDDFGIINQLFWREFYFYIGYYNPRVLEGKSLKLKYDKIKWVNNPIFIEAWKKGETGFPVVDAAMRQLNTIGYMHNRGRLIVSSLLIKILQTDWRIGEKYFAQNLTDYDPLVNNGNWQWGAGSGADSQPYFRIFNPWTQSKKFDPNCVYIKKWIPELKSVPNKEIHQWDKYFQNYKSLKYPGPITKYETARIEIQNIYKDAFK